jgi:omega-6 fatty acid desaturase (delta-12 desaturase)
MFGIGPAYMFLLQQRLPIGMMKAGWAPWLSAMGTNLATALLVLALAQWFTLGVLAIVLVPIVLTAAAAGMWLFYVQHQFEDAYWKDHGNWDYATAAIRGSSYFKLPAVLRWMTGSIGLHHVHHLGPRVPNYRLQRCHDENALFHDVTVLTIAESARTLRLSLWDEDEERLIGFSDLARKTAAAAN